MQGNSLERGGNPTITTATPSTQIDLHFAPFLLYKGGLLPTEYRYLGGILPKLRLNRHLPAPVLFGPQAYGGLEFPDIYTLQDQVQLEYL